MPRSARRKLSNHVGYGLQRATVDQPHYDRGHSRHAQDKPKRFSSGPKPEIELAAPSREGLDAVCWRHAAIIAHAVIRPAVMFAASSTIAPGLCATPRRVSTTGLILGIDAGGTSVRARGWAGERVVFAGRGGPGNPLVASDIELRQSYEDALNGCPPPQVIAACVAGAGSPEGRHSIERILGERFPVASVHVVPDYVATWMAAPEGTDVVVVCGTGSIACTRMPDGSFRTSGGHGWLLSDHGSAVRLGKAVLEHHYIDPDGALGEQLQRLYSASDTRALADRLRMAANPAAAMAVAAPLLTDAAANGCAWASRLLTREMAALAQTAARLLPRRTPDSRPARVALAGGVFRSPAAKHYFEASCDRLGLNVSVVKVEEEEGVVGAVRLGQALMRGEGDSH